ncbi:MAG: bifunctional folylpolyglutamate synthase/dihydrofolate synthase [Firmicutes bacterium]|nr:bifunctional folylpolyglutamate synthase/dihydrofolate synthase [Bacillota bacterium]MDO4860720.1 folylpolyglutamate synthase/dihydrofolate synthase family protein [Bacillota bacterium]
MSRSAEERIAKYHRFGSVLGLERIRMLLGKLGDPHKDLKVIHVAGTNGKGSVCREVYEVLQANGYKTGLYISPFIEKFNERIVFDGQDIPDDELDAITDTVIKKSDEMVAEGYDSPTEFEVVTAIALVYFKQHGADFAVLEVGLGGRGDSTNVIDRPLVTAITSIDFDHMERLGYTLEEIAAEKAGIIKEGVPLVSNVLHREALELIARRAYEKNAPLIDVSRMKTAVKDSGLESQTFDFYADEKVYRDVEISMPGRHQIENAKTALAILEVMRSRHMAELEMDKVLEGMKKAVQPARIEVMSVDPMIILDGGHNKAGAEALRQTLEEVFTKEQKITMVAGILRDKEVDGILDVFDRVADRYILTEIDNPRTVTADMWPGYMEGRNTPYDVVRSPREAVAKALSEQKDDCVIVAGSLYLAGQVRGYLKECIKNKV